MSEAYKRNKMTSDSWLTPTWILKPLGKFDLDPCGLQKHKTAEKIIQLPKNGLTEDWSNKRIWLNPPFGSEAKIWVKKFIEYKSGIILLAARVDTNWFHELVFNQFTGILFIKNRVQFLNKNLKVMETGALMVGVVLVAYSKFDAKILKNCDISGKFLENM